MTTKFYPGSVAVCGRLRGGSQRPKCGPHQGPLRHEQGQPELLPGGACGAGRRGSPRQKAQVIPLKYEVNHSNPDSFGSGETLIEGKVKLQCRSIINNKFSGKERRSSPSRSLATSTTRAPLSRPGRGPGLRTMRTTRTLVSKQYRKPGNSLGRLHFQVRDLGLHRTRLSTARQK
jgi:hypothetical protein